MSIRAFTGGAGCGKTFQLMEALSRQLQHTPLTSGQKILALTFMHGSRKRLNRKLSEVIIDVRSYECSTIDSFAWRIVNRWRDLCQHLGYKEIEPDSYDAVCELAGKLLSYEVVLAWVGRTFPLLIIDEAQDLSLPRLNMVKNLSKKLLILIAADEFQCLDERLRPNLACKWIQKEADVYDLDVSRRTDVPELLSAARAIRNGEAPASGKEFSVHPGYRLVMAGAYLSNQLAWRCRGGTTAIIAPAAQGYAESVIKWVGLNQTRHRSGPYDIQWESSPARLLVKLLAQFDMPDVASLLDVEQAVSALDVPFITKSLCSWLSTQRRCAGREEVSRVEVEEAIRSAFFRRKMFGSESDYGIRAMTVHGAKNREFDSVIVLWPASVTGSEEQKRRLLYNAVTRAKKRCLVLVQAKKDFESPPFV